MDGRGYTYYAVIRNGQTIYEGMGKKEAREYAKKHGGSVVTKKAQ